MAVAALKQTLDNLLGLDDGDMFSTVSWPWPH